MPSSQKTALTRKNGNSKSVTTLSKNGNGSEIWTAPAEKKIVAKKPEIDLSFTDQDMMTMMMVVMMVMMMQQMFSPTVQSAQRFFTNQSYQGNVESNVVLANDTVQYWDLINQSPFTPLISVYLINRGTNRVYVAINAAQDWLEIRPRETRTVSHVGADKRIEIIFYKCDAGLTSYIEAEGHF